ncbi:MAG: hypothetical protein HYV59_09830 [Planctomycetes bacterium]|nr:hypothetical protein [Planctomycetota bacterium]
MKKPIVRRTALIFFCTAIIICCAGFPVVTAALPQPVYGTATVDGDISEWNLAEDGGGDFFANMYRAAKSSKKVESKLYLRYDCTINTLYALVLPVSGVSVIASPGDAFVKLGNSNKLVDGNDGDNGTPPDFAWYNLSGGIASGWEASASLAPDAYPNFNVHTQVVDGGEQTSAVEDRAISLEIVCAPTAVELLNFTAETDGDGVVTLQWETATEIDNAGFNLYRSRMKDGNYKKINEGLIVSTGGQTEGASYRYEDIPPASGTYYYKLEDVDSNGASAMHGPLKMKVRSGGSEARRR